MRADTVKAALSAGVLLPAGLALNYLLSVVVARSLSVDDFGLFGFVQSLTVILALVATLGFSQSTMRFTASYRATGTRHARLAGLLRFSGVSVLAASATSLAFWYCWPGSCPATVRRSCGRPRCRSLRGRRLAGERSPRASPDRGGHRAENRSLTPLLLAYLRQRTDSGCEQRALPVPCHLPGSSRAWPILFFFDGSCR